MTGDAQNRFNEFENPKALSGEVIDSTSGRQLDRWLHLRFFRNKHLTGCPAYSTAGNTILELQDQLRRQGINVFTIATSNSGFHVKLVHGVPGPAADWELSATGATMGEALARAALKVTNLKNVEQSATLALP